MGDLGASTHAVKQVFRQTYTLQSHESLYIIPNGIGIIKGGYQPVVIHEIPLKIKINIRKHCINFLTYAAKTNTITRQNYSSSNILVVNQTLKRLLNLLVS